MLVRVRVFVAAVRALKIVAVHASGSQCFHPGPTGCISGSRLFCTCPTGSESGSASVVTPRLAFKEFKRPECGWGVPAALPLEAVAEVTL